MPALTRRDALRATAIAPVVATVAASADSLPPVIDAHAHFYGPRLRTTRPWWRCMASRS